MIANTTNDLPGYRITEAVAHGTTASVPAQ